MDSGWDPLRWQSRETSGPLAPPHNISFNYFYNASEEVNGNYVQPPVVVEGVVSFPLFFPYFFCGTTGGVWSINTSELTFSPSLFQEGGITVRSRHWGMVNTFLCPYTCPHIWPPVKNRKLRFHLALLSTHATYILRVHSQKNVFIIGLNRQTDSECITCVQCLFNFSCHFNFLRDVAKSIQIPSRFFFLT